MADDKLAGHLGPISPTLTGALDLLVKHAPKARTLALRYEDRPEAFEGLIAVEGGSAFLPDGSPSPDYQREIDAFLCRARETLPGLLDLVTRDLRIVLGRRPHPADGAPPWPACNITTSTTGREYHEAIKGLKTGGTR